MMALDFVIDRAELVKALEMIDDAIKQGFLSSQAVLRLTSVSDLMSETKLSFRGSIILREKPDDPNTNWGVTNAPLIYKLIDGECVLADDR